MTASWGLLILLGLVGLVLAVMVLAINESTRTIGFTIGAILLALVGLSIGFFVAMPVHRVPAPVQVSSPPPAIQLQNATPTVHGSGDPAETTLPAEQEPASAEKPLEAESSSPTSKVESPPPDWVDRPGHLQGTIYRTSVKSGLFVTRAECNEALVPKIDAAIADYINDYLFPGAASKVKIDAALTKRIYKGEFEEALTSASVGPMRQLHALLEFDDATRSEFTHRWHQTLVSHRLALVTLAGGLVLGLLGVAAGYLKLDLLSAGEHRGWLKLAAGAAILLLVTTVAVVVG